MNGKYKDKNVVFLVIDSFSEKCRKNLPGEVMPFLSSLEKNSQYFPNMYSEAPYTEAAVMSLFCGKNTLSDGGYLERFKYSENMFDCFSAGGYDVYNYIQPHVHPSSIIRGKQRYYYNVCPDFAVLWEYRLYFYAGLYKDGKLTAADNKKIEELLDDNFVFFKTFFEEILGGAECTRFIRDNIFRCFTREEIESAFALTESEAEKYKKNKPEYIKELLINGREHALFKIPVLNQTRKISDETREWIKDNYSGLFGEIKKENERRNSAISKFSFSGAFFDLKIFLKKRSRESLKNFLRRFKIYRDSVKDADLYERLLAPDSFKAAPSIYSHIKFFSENIRERNSEKPFFSCIHIDDIHNPEVFFTYDTEDKELLKEEFKDAENTLKALPKSYKGSVTYALSLSYIDKKIKMLFDTLREQNLLSDTVVFITGDHGFSFSFQELRNSYVNNHYLENYSIPFFAVSDGEMPEIDERICSSADILPTLKELFSLPTPNDRLTGVSLSAPPRDYVILQNVMGGCPDTDYRPVSMGVLYDNKLLVGEAYKASGFRDIEYTEYYDLKKDPLQKKNLVYKTEISKECADRLRREFEQLYVGGEPPEAAEIK